MVLCPKEQCLLIKKKQRKCRCPAALKPSSALHTYGQPAPSRRSRLYTARVHRDWEAIDWLADHLTDARRTKELSLLLVTHDRSFLERTCGEILELDSAAVYSYQTDGSYATRTLALARTSCLVCDPNPFPSPNQLSRMRPYPVP